MEFSNRNLLRGLAYFVICFAACLPASAATFTWNGNAGNALISTGGNWVGGSAPGSGSDLQFGAETINGLGGAAFNAGITFSASTVSFVVGASSGFFLTAATPSDVLNITGSGTTMTNTSNFQMTTSTLTVSIGGNQTWDGGSKGFNISNIDLGNDRTLTLTGTGTTNATNNVIAVNIDGTGTSGLTKAGTGALVLSGSASYIGATTVNNGVLQLGASNRISDTSNLVLNGGTFSTGGFNETVGKLSLTNFSTIDFGSSNTSDLVFALSSDQNWGAFTLNIINFNPGQDTLRFGTNASGLTSAQLLNNIRFNGTTAGQIDSLGFVTLVPEPSVFGLALLSGIGLICGWRRRARQV